MTGATNTRQKETSIQENKLADGMLVGKHWKMWEGNPKRWIWQPQESPFLSHAHGWLLVPVKRLKISGAPCLFLEGTGNHVETIHCRGSPRLEKPIWANANICWQSAWPPKCPEAKQVEHPMHPVQNCIWTPNNNAGLGGLHWNS